MIADNDLDFYATANINDMEVFMAENPSAGSVYVYIDRAKNRKTAHPILYKITADTTPEISSEIISVYSEQNSADENVFEAILQNVISISAKQNEKINGVVLWSHGSGRLPHASSLNSVRATATKSFGIDMTVKEEGAIGEMDIKKLAQKLKPYHFEFLLFDTCFMASIEVFYEIKDSFDYIIASPTEVLATGLPYKGVLPDLLSTDIQYSNITKKYVSFSQQKKGILKSASGVIVKTSELKNLASAFKKNNLTLLNTNDLENILQYDQNRTGWLFDMGQAAKIIEKQNDLDGNITSQIYKTIHNYNHTEWFFSEINLTKSSGISIYIPDLSDGKTIENNYYKTLSWCNDAGFISFFNHIP
ncbi:MAG: clostripain-related cysteine peptidase [Capnocytophaga sp.]|nr:clostripain-related cysteine peptidase [Capnocytophaga sp.]